MEVVTGFVPGFLAVVVLLARFGIAETRFSRALEGRQGRGRDIYSVDSPASFLRTARAGVSHRDRIIQDIDSGVIDDPELHRLLAERRRRLLQFAIGAPACLLLTIPWSYAAHALFSPAGTSAADPAPFIILAFVVVGSVAIYQTYGAFRAHRVGFAAAMGVGLAILGGTLIYVLMRR